jgi:hypothetical protein
MYTRTKLTNAASDEPRASGNLYGYNAQCTPHAQHRPTNFAANARYTAAHTNDFANRNRSTGAGQETGYLDLMGRRSG